MTNELSLISAFFIGLAGSVHCVGMCGGIVGALTYTLPTDKPVLGYHIAYNFGRITSYSIAGAITGYLGAIFSHHTSQGLLLLQLLSGIMLVFLASYIGNWWQGLAHLEKAGGYLWRHLSPMSKKLLPLATPIKALPYGMIWGWLPCGLVYSTLSWSLASGSALQGAAIMLFFGLGTLPALLALGQSSHQIRLWLAKPWLKRLIAWCLLIYAFWLIFNAIVLS